MLYLRFPAFLLATSFLLTVAAGAHASESTDDVLVADAGVDPDAAPDGATSDGAQPEPADADADASQPVARPACDAGPSAHAADAPLDDTACCGFHVAPHASAAPPLPLGLAVVASAVVLAVARRRRRNGHV